MVSFNFFCNQIIKSSFQKSVLQYVKYYSGGLGFRFVNLGVDWDCYMNSRSMALNLIWLSNINKSVIIQKF